MPIYDEILQLGFASWDWSLFQPIGRGRESGAQFAVPGERIVAAWEALFTLVEAGEFDGFPLFPVKKYLDNFVAGPGGNMCMRPQCGAARDLLSLSADGTIEACDCIDPLGPLSGLGRLGQTSLEQARASAPAQLIRSRDLSATACGDCLWYAVCGGTCLAHAGSLDGVWEESCQLSQHAFPRIAESLARDRAVIRYLESVA